MDMQGIRLNKYIADSGFCSRREAERLIEQGRVAVDGRTGTLGDRVTDGMVVTVDGREMNRKEEKVYLVSTSRSASSAPPTRASR